MHKMTPMLFLAVALVGCSTFHLRSQPVPSIGTQVASLDGMPIAASPPAAEPTAPTESGDFGVLQRLVDFTRVDINNGLTGATTGKDDVGIQCHTAGLALLDSFNPPQMQVTGIASAAEKLRLVRRAAANSAPKLEEVRDRCAALYNVTAVFRPLFDAVGLARLVLP